MSDETDEQARAGITEIVGKALGDSMAVARSIALDDRLVPKVRLDACRVLIDGAVWTAQMAGSATKTSSEEQN